MSPRSLSTHGYILVETAVALVVLSAGAFVVHGTIQQALQTRGQAQDYTRARFLLEGLVADLEMQPQVAVHAAEGRFEGEHDRFSWDYRVRRVNVPKPVAPLRPAPEGSKKAKPFEYLADRDYLAHMRATVYWTRSGRSFSESYETLLRTSKLWQPPKATSKR